MEKVDVVCNLNPDCPNYGRTINRVSGVVSDDAEMLIDDINTGGGDPETDKCPLCGEMGEADYADDERPLAPHIQQYHPEISAEINNGEPRPI